MKKVLVVLGVLVAIYGCDKVKTDAAKLEGTYIGYFHRSGQDTTTVTLHFSGNLYQGQSTSAAYTAIGNGTFDQLAEQINFLDTDKNSSLDATLLLKGEYNYQTNNDGTIRIWRQNDQEMDEFILMRPMNASMAINTNY